MSVSAFMDGASRDCAAQQPCISHQRIALPHESRQPALTWRALRGGQPDALFVIVPALALPTKLAAAAYIITFVIGTVAAMGGYAAVIGAGLIMGHVKAYWIAITHKPAVMI